MSQIEHMAYIAREKCGCITGAVVDDPKYAKATAEDVATFIKDGRVVERVSCDLVRINFGKGNYPLTYSRRGNNGSQVSFQIVAAGKSQSSVAWRNGRLCRPR